MDITGPGAKVSEPVVLNWWRQGDDGRSKSSLRWRLLLSLKQIFTEDLKKIEIPVLILHGEDDQVVPFEFQVKICGTR